MNKGTVLVWAVVAGFAVVAGCDRGDDRAAKDAVSNSAPAAAAHSEQAAPGVHVVPPIDDPAHPSASSGPGTPSVVYPTSHPAAATEQGAAATGAAAGGSARTAAASEQAAAGSAQAAGGSGAATEGGTGASAFSAAGAQAAIQPQIDQAVAYVKEKKFDLAQQALDKLDQEKASWPASVRQTYDTKIDSVRKMLTAAKGGSSALDTLKGAFPGK